MTSNKISLAGISAFANERYGIKFKFKDESRFMRFLGVVLLFNKKFMTSYTSVIGDTVYFPSKKWMQENDDRAASVLCHELVHIDDGKRVGKLTFTLSYLFPQLLALFALSAFVVGPWALLFLVFLGPWPAPVRSFWELRGYMMTDIVRMRQSGEYSRLEWIMSQFTSSAYYFMWWSPKHIKNEIEINRDIIENFDMAIDIPPAEDILSAAFGPVDD
jgi:hypothetical protein